MNGQRFSMNFLWCFSNLSMRSPGKPSARPIPSREISSQEQSYRGNTKDYDHESDKFYPPFPSVDFFFVWKTSQRHDFQKDVPYPVAHHFEENVLEYPSDHISSLRTCAYSKRGFRIYFLDCLYSWIDPMIGDSVLSMPYKERRLHPEENISEICVQRNSGSNHQTNLAKIVNHSDINGNRSGKLIAHETSARN